jgi:hypothetical protein
MRIYSMLVGVNEWNTVADTRTCKMFVGMRTLNTLIGMRTRNILIGMRVIKG